jgi:hypothetical protein
MHNKNMEESFDPYLQWLAIRDPKRPPNHYRLLGLDLFESDLEVIQNAADRQMTHIRRFQGGKHSAESQKLLNELAAAKICLLQTEKKAAYDAELRAETQPTLRVTTPPPIAREESPSPPPLTLSPAAAERKSSTEEVSIPSRPLARVNLHEWSSGTKINISTISFYLSILVAVAAILLGAFVLWSNANKKTQVEPPAARSAQEEVK